MQAPMRATTSMNRPGRRAARARAVALPFVLVSLVTVFSGCAGTASPRGAATPEGPSETAGREAPVEVALGAHRLRIPREYFRYRSVPTTGRSIELVLHWPELGPGPYPPPTDPLAAAADVQVTVLTTERMPAATLSAWRGEYLKRKPEGGMVDPEGRVRGEPVDGLTPYYAARKQRPDEDWFLANPTPQGAGTVIACTSRTLDDGAGLADGRLVHGRAESDVLATCRHSFELPRHGAIVHADYPRVLLGHWKRIEARVGLLLDGGR